MDNYNYTENNRLNNQKNSNYSIITYYLAKLVDIKPLNVLFNHQPNKII